MNKKLKLLTSVPVIIGIFAISYAALGMVYLNKQSESRDLNSQITLRRTTLQKPKPNIEALKTKLTQTEAKSQAMLASLPNTQQGIDIYSVLVDLARKANVEISNITASLPILPKDSKNGETILPYSITVRGSQQNTLAFISSVVQGTTLLQGLELKNINIEAGTLSDSPDITQLDLYVHTWPDSLPDNQVVAQTSGSKK